MDSEFESVSAEFGSFERSCESGSISFIRLQVQSCKSPRRDDRDSDSMSYITMRNRFKTGQNGIDSTGIEHKSGLGSVIE